MIQISDAAALARAMDSPLAPELKQLLITRRDQLLTDVGEYELSELVQWIVVEPRDPIAEIEAAATYPLVTSPAFEWVTQNGGWFEAVTILSDDGFGLVLLVPDAEGVDATLLALLREQVCPPFASSSGEQNMN